MFVHLYSSQFYLKLKEKAEQQRLIQIWIVSQFMSMMVPVIMQVFECILQGGASCYPAPLSSFVSVACIFSIFLSSPSLWGRKWVYISLLMVQVDGLQERKDTSFFPFKDQSRDHPLCGSSKVNQEDTFQPLQAFNDIFLVFCFFLKKQSPNGM